MADAKKAPVLRFRGFSGDWVVQPFSSTFSYLSNNTLSRAELNYENGEVKDIHYGDVLIKYGECVDVSSDSLPFVTKRSLTSEFQHSFLTNGDVVMADTAEDETVGKSSEVIGVNGDKVVAGLHTIPLRPKRQFAPGYLGFYINSNSYHDQLKPLMQGTKVTSVSKTGLQDTVIRYPSSLKEQEAIAQFQSNITKLIIIQQRKQQKLVNLKQSMLERLFPRPGERTPELRFAGFSGDWEQRELGTVFTEYSEKNHAELPALTIIQGHGTVKREDSDRNLSYDKASLANYKLVNRGDFIVHLRSFEGGLEMANSRGIVSPAYHVFHGENTDSRFYYPYFRSYNFIHVQLLPCVYGIRDGRSIDIDEMKKIKIPWTSYEEQKKIGDFIAGLDCAIALHQRKLTKLRHIKQALLSKMFV